MAIRKNAIPSIYRRLSICGVLSAAALLAGALAPSVFSRPVPGNDSPGRTDSPESQMLNLTNQDRTAQQNWEETQGRAHPLQWDDRLAAAASAHSQDMARAGYLSHDRIGRKHSLATGFLYGDSVAFHRRKCGPGA